jgi:hypothetical protein
MKTAARLAAVLLTATAGFAAPMTLGVATPAFADNCEVTEPVVRVVRPNYEEPILTNQDSPVCYVMTGFVYPRLCDDPTTLFQSCLATIAPDPFSPVVVPAYQPDAGRIFCTSSTFVLSTGGVPSGCTP